ncbi:MAG: right-handed parallel beta-helix repeat-containing protein [Chloroflexi bacterium]|nr:right-handed parallel beta-helix repeat-containing protein [Chloroflexota bacterium]
MLLTGLQLEAGRGEGIRITAGEGVRVERCTLRNLGTDGVVIERGSNHRVTRCTVSYTGDSGITAYGGDRRTLTGSGVSIDNNRVHHIARWSRTYCTAVHITGVGMRVAHNELYDLPHTAVMYWGNDHLVEYNHIHHVTLETGDAGAIYTGRDYTTRGNLVRYNYIHDTGGYGMGSMGVYLDDCVSGQTVYGNVFARVHRAVMIGGGSDIRVENNVFIDCHPSLWVDARGTDPWPIWVNMVHDLMRKRYEELQPHELPWRRRYPELLALNLESFFAERKPIPPLNVRIAHNISVGGEWMDSSWHKEAADYMTWEDNLVDADPCFVAAEREDYRLRADSPAWALGFKALPLERIGPEEDDGR